MPHLFNSFSSPTTVHSGFFEHVSTLRILHSAILPEKDSSPSEVHKLATSGAFCKVDTDFHEMYCSLMG